MTEQKIAKLLLEIKAVTLSINPPYTWTSGIKAPIYCDNRLIMSYPEKRKQVRDAFISLIDKIGVDFDIIGGVATGGIPHAAFIADGLNKPMIYIRGKAKGHGKTNQVEGKLEKGQKVLIIEDLYSTAGSTINAVNAVREAGGVVEFCIAVFTYELEKAKKAFEEANVHGYALSNFSTLVQVATEENYLSSEDKENVLTWSRDPENWGNKL